MLHCKSAWANLGSAIRNPLLCESFDVVDAFRYCLAPKSVVFLSYRRWLRHFNVWAQSTRGWRTKQQTKTFAPTYSRLCKRDVRCALSVSYNKLDINWNQQVTFRLAWGCGKNKKKYVNSRPPPKGLVSARLMLVHLIEQIIRLKKYP